MEGFTLNGILLGVTLAIVFTLFTVLSFIGTKNKKGKSTFKDGSSLPRKVAGTFGLVLGSIMLVMWLYYFFQGRESFMSHFTTVVTHAGTMLLSSIALLLGSYAMLRHWKRGPAMLMTAIGTLMFSVFLALI
jgi:hypothetical protein